MGAQDEHPEVFVHLFGPLTDWIAMWVGIPFLKHLTCLSIFKRHEGLCELGEPQLAIAVQVISLEEQGYFHLLNIW